LAAYPRHRRITSCNAAASDSSALRRSIWADQGTVAGSLRPHPRHGCPSSREYGPSLFGVSTGGKCGIGLAVPGGVPMESVSGGGPEARPRR
jgi:hypothetical protein